jgi:hypothetical protein
MRLWQWMRSRFLFLVWLGIVAAPGIGLRWLDEKHPEFVPSPIKAILVIGYGLYCIATFYLLMSTVHYLNEDMTTTFFGAVRRGIESLRQLIRWIPIIGALFEPDEDETRYDPDDK